MYILISFFMAVIPSLLFVWYYYKQDKLRRQPKGLIIKVFMIGSIYTLPVYFLEYIVSLSNAYFDISYILFYFFEAFIVTGLCEEYIKLRIVKKYVYETGNFSGIMDGIIYTITASLGFACMENVIYVMHGTLAMALARGVTAVPMHAVCGGMMGYYIGMAKFAGTKKEEKFLMNRGLWLAICVHGLYDFLLFISPIIGSIFSFLTIPLILGTYWKVKEKIHMALKAP